MSEIYRPLVLAADGVFRPIGGALDFEGEKMLNYPPASTTAGIAGQFMGFWCACYQRWQPGVELCLENGCISTEGRT